ncbi:MAG: DUF4012 domain-containing protein, partial [Kineosporiaceae bacterium]
DPVWAAVAHLPWLGRPAATVRGLTDAVDSVATQSLPALAAATTDVHPARVLDSGRLDVVGLASAAEPLGRATTTLESQRDAIGGLDPSWLAPVRQAHADLHEQLIELAALTSSAHTATQVAPGMLGKDGPRRYFVGFQNPAEARGTGGLLDAFAIVKAEKGSLVVERTGANTDLPALPATIEGIGNDFLDRYQAQGATALWVNANLSPHFPEVGKAWVAMWKASTGQQLDGAVALDPKALAEVLSATGPVSVPVVGTVGADRVENLVLLGQYQRPELGAQRKQLMLGVGVKTMEAVLSGAADAQKLVPKLRDAAHNGHVLLYSRNGAEQAALVRSGLAGAVAIDARPFAQAVVVNAAGNKLDTWLTQSLAYRVEECSASGRTVAVTIGLRNDAPRKGLPEYVTVRSDKPRFTTVTGQNRIEVQLLATLGAHLTSATLDGKKVPLAPPDGDLPARLPDGGLSGGGQDTGFLQERVSAGRPSYGLDLELVPGAGRTLQVRFVEPAGTTGAPRLPVQTMVHTPSVTADVSACGRAS